jgi:hypothetical protein
LGRWQWGNSGDGKTDSKSLLPNHLRQIFLIFGLVVQSTLGMTVPKANYIVDSQGRKVFVQLSVQEWEKLVQEFRRMESLLSFKSKLKNAFREVREIQRGERTGQTIDAFLESDF